MPRRRDRGKIQNDVHVYILIINHFTEVGHDRLRVVAGQQAAVDFGRRSCGDEVGLFAAGQHGRRNRFTHERVLPRYGKELPGEGGVVPQRLPQIKEFLRAAVKTGQRFEIVAHRIDDSDWRTIGDKLVERMQQCGDGGVRRWHRRMARRSLAAKAKPQRRLFGDRDRIETAAVGALGNFSAFVQQITGVAKNTGLMINQPAGAILSALLLVGRGQEQDVAVEQNSGALDGQHRHQFDNPRPFIVDRTASPYLAVFDLPEKGGTCHSLGSAGTTSMWLSSTSVLL